MVSEEEACAVMSRRKHYNAGCAASVAPNSTPASWRALPTSNSLSPSRRRRAARPRWPRGSTGCAWRCPSSSTTSTSGCCATKCAAGGVDDRRLRHRQRRDTGALAAGHRRANRDAAGAPRDRHPLPPRSRRQRRVALRAFRRRAVDDPGRVPDRPRGARAQRRLHDRGRAARLQAQRPGRGARRQDVQARKSLSRAGAGFSAHLPARDRRRPGARSTGCTGA